MSTHDKNILLTPHRERNIRSRATTKTNNDNNKVEDLTGSLDVPSQPEDPNDLHLREDADLVDFEDGKISDLVSLVPEYSGDIISDDGNAAEKFTEKVIDEGLRLDKKKHPSLMQFLFVELTRGYLLEHDEARFSARREKVYSFMKIPREVEKFMAYGFFQCADSFLFVYTFLPMRFILALFAFITRPIRECFGMYKTASRGILSPAEICDLLKGSILIICTGIILYIDTSMMYHLIKSQSVIKLYIFFNMLEVGDRLFSAFGQDILDALFWTATEPKDRKREHFGLIPHILFAVIYVFLHSLVVLFQATTLNVAVNSNNKSLLTIMMSNNFVELKGSVFKKFDKNNLFQVSCSDVRERFQLFILLSIVILQTMKEYSWKEDRFYVLLPDCFFVLVAEVLIDWIKHAFITRFNELNIDVYRDYTLSFAYDIAQTRQKHAFSDHSDLIARRMGFIPLPLGVVMFRVLVQALHIEGGTAILITLLGYLCLLSFRVLNSLVLLGKACDLIGSHRHDNPMPMEGPPSSQPPPSPSGSAATTSAPPQFLQPAEPNPPIFTNSLVSINKISLNESLYSPQNDFDTKEKNLGGSLENLKCENGIVQKQQQQQTTKEGCLLFKKLYVDESPKPSPAEESPMIKRAESEPSIPLLLESLVT